MKLLPTIDESAARIVAVLKKHGLDFPADTDPYREEMAKIADGLDYFDQLLDSIYTHGWDK